MSGEEYVQFFGDLGLELINASNFRAFRNAESRIQQHPKYFEYLVRLTSRNLRAAKNMNAYPILDTSISSIQYSHAEKSDVISITLNNLPYPDDSTSWEQIFDYRKDAE